MKTTPIAPHSLQPEPRGTVLTEVASSGDDVSPAPLKDPYEYVQDLLERAHDGQAGYAKAAELTDSEDLKKFFLDNSFQREEFATELGKLLAQAGREVQESGSLSGKLHQNWMTLVSKFSAGEDGLLAECQRGEETALGEYDEALSGMNLPETIFIVVEKQRDRLRSELVVLGNLKELESVCS